MSTVDRMSTWSQDETVSSLDPKFMWLLSMFFGGAPKQFTGEFIEYDVVEGGVRIAPFGSPLSLGKSTTRNGYLTKQIKPAYIKLLDTVRPGDGFTRLAGEKYGGELSPAERLARRVAEQIVLHHDMIDTRLEAMAAEVLFTGKLTITHDNYPVAVADFERDPNLVITAGTVWSNPAADIVGNIEAAADKVNTSSRGTVPNKIVTRTAVWDHMRKNAGVLELLEKDKNRSPSTNLDVGPRNASKMPQYRGRLSNNYDIWTYDGYYEADNGTAVPFVPANKVLLSSESVEGQRYHGAIFDMEAGMAALEVFTKQRELWNPSGVEVLTQSAPMLGMRRPNASAVLTVG